MSKTEDVARRAVACKGFRWLVGAAERCGDRVISEGGYNGPEWASQDVGPVRRPWAEGDPLPDMDDPATLGCFEHGLLVEAWGDCITVTRITGMWRVGADQVDGHYCNSPSKAEAMVMLLEAAERGVPS